VIVGAIESRLAASHRNEAEKRTSTSSTLGACLRRLRTRSMLFEPEHRSNSA